MAYFVPDNAPEAREGQALNILVKLVPAAVLNKGTD